MFRSHNFLNAVSINRNWTDRNKSIDLLGAANRWGEKTALPFPRFIYSTQSQFPRVGPRGQFARSCAATCDARIDDPVLRSVTQEVRDTEATRVGVAATPYHQPRLAAERAPPHSRRGGDNSRRGGEQGRRSSTRDTGVIEFVELAARWGQKEQIGQSRADSRINGRRSNPTPLINLLVIYEVPRILCNGWKSRDGGDLIHLVLFSRRVIEIFWLYIYLGLFPRLKDILGIQWNE